MSTAPEPDEDGRLRSTIPGKSLPLPPEVELKSLKPVSESDSAFPGDDGETPDIQETLNDQLYFVDIARTNPSDSHASFVIFEDVAAPSVQITQQDDDIPSDTEEVYIPRAKSGERANDLESKSSHKSSRSYAVVVDDQFADYAQAMPVPGVSFEEMQLVTQLTRQHTASSKTPKLSRMAQKKKDKRDARERKKLRKKGQLTVKLFQEMEIGSDEDFREKLENSLDHDLPMETVHSSTTVKAKRAPARQSTAEAALHDYISNIEAGDDFDAELSFLQTSNFKDLQTSELPDSNAEFEQSSSPEAHDVDGRGLASLLHIGSSSDSGDFDFETFYEGLETKAKVGIQTS